MYFTNIFRRIFNNAKFYQYLYSKKDIEKLILRNGFKIVEFFDADQRILVRAVKNAISIKGQSNFKSTAKDVLITSQLRTALIFNKKTKARNYTLETINKNIYIFGIAMNAEEKKEVINEASKIYDVEEIFPSIYLATELSRNKL